MIDIDTLERIAQAAFSYSLTGMAAFDAEIKFGQTFTPAGVLDLITELRTLRARLEIDPSHSADGIDARDATIRGLEADAARYQWLKPRFRTFSLDMGGQHTYCAEGEIGRIRGPNLDMAIDAAIAKRLKEKSC